MVAPDLSSWRIKDEDVFAWSVDVGHLTAAEAEAIRTEAERVIERIERRLPPFCDGWEKWVPDLAWGTPELLGDWQSMS